MPISWLTEEAKWVPQWTLSSEKLEAATKLVNEQLQLGHLEPSISPWNTPIFVIKKKSGKWRLLHDLRAINAQMRLFGSIQRGLPLLSALPKQWKIIIVDIKDCFFSIPLCPQDRQRFAFTILYQLLIILNLIRDFSGGFCLKAWPVAPLCANSMCNEPLNLKGSNFLPCCWLITWMTF